MEWIGRLSGCFGDRIDICTSNKAGDELKCFVFGLEFQVFVQLNLPDYPYPSTEYITLCKLVLSTDIADKGS